MICVIHGYFEGYCDICHVPAEEERELVTADAEEDD